MEDIVKLADLIVKVFLGVVGLYLAHNFRRQIKQKSADGRIKAYSELWGKMEVASPTRCKQWHTGPLMGPLRSPERMRLHLDFTEWYYKNGNGMFLGDQTRKLYLAAKDNLVCPHENLQPSRLSDILGLNALPEEKQLEKRGELVIHQLSLLRTRMKADLEVYGALYFGKLQPTDIAFLEYCGENWREKPWSGHQERNGEREDE